MKKGTAHKKCRYMTTHEIFRYMKRNVDATQHSCIREVNAHFKTSRK